MIEPSEYSQKYSNCQVQVQVLSPKSKSKIQVQSLKSKVQRKGTGTGAGTIILQATSPPLPPFLTWNGVGKRPSSTFLDLPGPSMTFYELSWHSMTFYELLSPSKTSMTFFDYMSIVKTWSYIRTSQTQAQINSYWIPRLDPINSKSSLSYFCLKSLFWVHFHSTLFQNNPTCPGPGGGWGPVPPDDLP